MAGHGDKIGRKREAAIAALLAEPTVEKAALKAGVGYRTLKGWMAEPDFAAAYRDARKAVVDEALAALQRANAKAVDALVCNLTCGDPAVEVRAASAVISHTLKITEAVELEQRIAALEAKKP